MRTKRTPAVLAALLSMLLCGSLQAAPPAEVMTALKRGVAPSIWFTYRGSSDIDTSRWYPDADDFRRMRALGFRHIRVQLDPAWLLDPAKPGTLRPERLAELKQNLVTAQSYGLMVVLVPEPDGEAKRRYVQSESGAVELEVIWRALAKALRDQPVNRLVFEVLNEPESADAASNRALMQRLVTAIRSQAPRHSIVVEGHAYSGVDELVAMQPLADSNLIYSFHFYEPFNFTYQGAFWGWPLWKKFSNWPYPSSPEAVAPLLAAADAEARPYLADYGQQRWNRARIDARLDQVGLWAARNEVAVWCGEFGVTRLGPPLDARRRWLTDVREALDARRIPWTLWDYTGNFALVTGKQGARVLDPADVVALDLTLPTGR